ncbi:MAG: response regulator [Pseudoflavonifractor sp.]|nr:response regulator [Pseudoflavonifractor sp.]MDY3020376.1 response regulator [Oscillospiraceae bacterium]
MGFYHIMVVDDEAEVRQGIARKIDWNALGFEIVADAENGRDALEKAENLDLDVVLTDIKMPFMDGLQLGAELARRKPGVRLIVFSGFDEFEFAKEAIKLNVVEYVLKPVNAAELSDILRRVKNTLDQEIEQRRNIDRLNEAYQRSLPLLREKFLHELLRAPMAAEQVRRQSDRFGLAVREGKYKLVSVCNVDVRPDRPPAIAPELVSVSVRQMLDEVLGKRCHREIFPSVTSVIVVTAWDKDPVEELMNLLGEVCDECSRIFNVAVTAGIGRPRERLEELYLSYAEARAAVEYKVITGTGRAIYIQDMERTGGTGEGEEQRREGKLLSAVKFGSTEQIASYVDQLLDEGGDAWSSQARLMAALGSLIPLIRRFGLGECEILGAREVWLELLKEDAPREEIRSWLLQVCLRMSKRLSQERVSGAKRLVEEAESYIREHYADSGLSVEALCQKLHISQSHFSTLFKQQTGMSCVQCITDARMDRAVELLRTTDDKTYQIAQKVGYDDPNYFSYVFKKKFGVSPSQYRK